MSRIRWIHRRMFPGMQSRSIFNLYVIGEGRAEGGGVRRGRGARGGRKSWLFSCLYMFRVWIILKIVLLLLFCLLLDISKIIKILKDESWGLVWIQFYNSFNILSRQILPFSPLSLTLFEIQGITMKSRLAWSSLYPSVSGKQGLRLNKGVCHYTSPSWHYF